MTWEEWKEWSKSAVEDPSWSYCNRSDCGACLGDDLKYQCDLLKAFADELVKRTGLGQHSAVCLTINELLTEAGVDGLKGDQQMIAIRNAGTEDSI